MTNEYESTLKVFGYQVWVKAVPILVTHTVFTYKQYFLKLFLHFVFGNYCFDYSQVPIKRVGPNKRVGWIF